VWGHGQETTALQDFGPSAAGLCPVGVIFVGSYGHGTHRMSALPPIATDQHADARHPLAVLRARPGHARAVSPGFALLIHDCEHLDFDQLFGLAQF
jgi:hypothetical protein